MSPCLIDWGEVIPQNVLMLSRKVDKCKPLKVGKSAVRDLGVETLVAYGVCANDTLEVRP